MRSWNLEKYCMSLEYLSTFIYLPFKFFPQPAVAVGNVGQLAVDLIVSTLNMNRVGYLHTDCLIPMAGNNPYATCKEDAEELHTPAEGNTRSLLESL